MTYIYETLNTNQIANALRQDNNANWSYDGAIALAEYLEELAEGIGEPIELDIVAIRCEFSEYLEDNFNDIAQDYDTGVNADDYDEEEEFHEALIEWLEGETTVIRHDTGLIFQCF